MIELLCTDYNKKATSIHYYFGNAVLGDGVDSSGNPVYFCYNLELWRLKRVRGKIEREGKGVIYCFDYQEEVIRNYFGTEIVIKGIIRDRAIQYLERYMI